MAKSLRSTPGKKQTYNLYDSGDLYRALKAINERIKEFEREFTQDSQLYRDYTAPMRALSLSQNVRFDKNGNIQFKTGKGSNVDQVRTAVQRMLSKATKGEIIANTRERMGIPKNVNEKGFMTYEDVKKMAEDYRMLYHEIDSLLQEIYNLYGEDGTNIIEENGIGYILDGHWEKLSYDQLTTAIDVLKKIIAEKAATTSRTSMNGEKA